MGDTMSTGEAGKQAYELFMKFPGGLFGPDTLLLMLQNRVNVSLKQQGLPRIALETASDLKTLPEPAAQAALDIIPTLRQMAPPSSSDIAALL